jgi:predicted Zn-dependent peptidase
MKSRRIALAAGCVLAAWVAGVAAAWNTEEMIRKLQYPPLGEIQVPEPERYELPNGMILYLLEDHEFPLVDVQVRMRAGSIYEPKEKAGLAELTGRVMRSGGSEAIPGDTLDLRLESMGARLSIFIGTTDGTASLSTLSEDFQEGLRILADVLRHPAFPPEKIDLEKVNLRTRIASRNDEPLRILMREFSKIVYGPDSPYGWYPEYATVDAITREDLVAFHRRYVRPDQMIVTVYGDFSTPQVEEAFRELFGDWVAPDEPLPPDPPLPAPRPPTVYYAYKEGTTNSSVAIGHLGFRADDPDYAAAMVLGKILGGSFSSRLFSEIRSRRGLAYAVGASAGVGFHHPGAFFARVETRIDSTTTTIRAVLRELERIREEGVTQEELEMAREAILNGLVFDFSDKSRVLNRLAFYEFYGYPSDFLQRYQEAVRQVTAADIQRVAREKIRPEEFQIVVVGDESKFDAPLSSLGFPVQQLDITIPEPPPAVEIPEPTPEALEEGRRILLAAAEAVADPKVLASIRSLRIAFEGTMSYRSMPEVSVSGETWKIYPDRIRSEFVLPFGKMVRTVDKDTGWVESPMGTMVMKPEEARESLSSLRRDPIFLLAEASKLEAQAVGTAEVEGRSCQVLYIRDASIPEWMVYVDAEDHRLVRMDYRTRGRSGPVTETVVFADWRPVGGVLYPHHQEMRQAGQKIYEMDLLEVEPNATPEPSLFARPEDLEKEGGGE